MINPSLASEIWSQENKYLQDGLTTSSTMPQWTSLEQLTRQWMPRRPQRRTWKKEMQLLKDSTTFHPYLKQVSPSLHRITQILWSTMSSSLQLPGHSTIFQFPSHRHIRINITSIHLSSHSTSMHPLCLQPHIVPAFRSIQSITNLTRHCPHLQTCHNSSLFWRIWICKDSHQLLL